MDYTVSIPSDINWGVAAARTAHNNELPATVPDPANAEGTIPNPDLIADDAAYMHFVMENAVKSWCAHYPEAAPPVLAQSKRGAKS